MAKNTGILRFRRRVGEFVGAKGRNGENIIRKHVDTIYNPRTNAQLAQRIKIAPAQNFYAALGEILDHSWQGVKYGADSMARFMSNALKMEDGFPYVKKGEKRPFPGLYLLSTGSLCQIDFTIDRTALNLKGDTSVDSYADFSRALLHFYPGLKDGDQLTFVICLMIDNNPVYKIGRFFINTNDTEVSHIFNHYFDEMNGLVFASESESEYPIRVVDSGAPSNSVVAGAVIVSRVPRKSSGNWQRSISSMKVINEYAAIYMGPVQLQHAMDSYAVEENAPNSEYYLNGGSGESSGGSGSGTVVITLTSDYPAAESQLTGAGSYQRGALVSVEAPSSVGEGTFSGWYEDGNFVSNASIYAFTASVNRTLQAQYTVNDEP